MLLSIILVILTPFALWLLYWYLRVSYFEKYLKSIPGPSPLPIVGNALEFGSSTEIFAKLMEYHKIYNGTFKIYIGSQPYLFLTEPKDVEFILNSTTILKKTDVYRFMHNWLGTGLITSWGNKWKKHRKIITPAFHFQILAEFVDVFNSNGDILVSKLSEELNKNSVDIYPFLTRCTLDIICETAMGTSVNAQENLDSEYMKCINLLLNVIIQRAFSVISSNNFLYPFTKLYQEEKYALRVLHGYTKSVMNKRKAEFTSCAKNIDEHVDYISAKKKRALLDLLLEYSLENPSFTEEDICQEINTFLFAGHDTTATSVSFTLYCLASNPHVQDKAYAELQTIFTDNPSRQPTYKDLQSMKYLEMVIKESLRMYSISPFYGRVMEKSTNCNGVVLPKGLMVNISSIGVHHSYLYKNPESFDPERFTVENTLAKHPFSYIPFSAGPRNCIGQKFAMLEMKALISNVLRNLQLLPTVPEHKVVLKSDAVLKSDNGVLIRLKRRVA